MTQISILFLVGPLVVVPLLFRLVPSTGVGTAERALRVATALSFPAAVALAAAFAVSPGALAATLAVPWVVVTGVGALVALAAGIAGLRDGSVWPPGPQHATWAALVFLAIGATNALADRAGVQPFGFAPVIVLLTAVHFTFAGFGLVLLGVLAYRRRPETLPALAIAALVVGMPVTAVGFLGLPIAAWLGAMLVASGGLGIGLAHVRASARLRSASARWLARLVGLGLLVSMPLAVGYATGVFVGVSWLDLPTMARTHGTLNVLAVVLPGAVAWHLEARARRRDA